MSEHKFEVFWYEMRFGKKKKVVKSDLSKAQAEGLVDALKYEGFKEAKMKTQS